MSHPDAADREPTPAPEPADDPRRTAMLIAAPLVVALLAAAALLWTRGAPERQGGFCARATAEAGALLDRADGSVRAQYDLAEQADAILALAYTVDIGRLVPGAPEEIRDDLTAAAAELPAYRDERDAAASRGESPPEPPANLRETLVAFLVAYEQRCILQEDEQG